MPKSRSDGRGTDFDRFCCLGFGSLRSALRSAIPGHVQAAFAWLLSSALRRGQAQQCPGLGDSRRTPYLWRRPAGIGIRYGQLSGRLQKGEVFPDGVALKHVRRNSAILAAQKLAPFHLEIRNVTPERLPQTSILKSNVKIGLEITNGITGIVVLALEA